MATAIAITCLVGCGKRQEPAPHQLTASPAEAPGAIPTNDASFQLLDADLPTRLAALQAVIVQAGNKCDSVTRGILTGGLDGTDEWRVDCTGSGSWQVWFSNDSGTEVDHCANAKCT